MNLVSRSTPDDDLMAAYLALVDADDPAGAQALLLQHPQRAAEMRAREQGLRDLGLLGHAGGPLGVLKRIGGFEVCGRLGSGGMGLVFQARSVADGREVALKVVRPELAQHGRARERFLREVAALRTLAHPGIVPILAAGEDQGLLYYAMELVAGRSLAAVLEAARGREPSRLTGSDLPEVGAATWAQAVLAVVARAAEALAAVHAAGVVHRDVSPGNLMLTADGGVVLVDFGLAFQEHLAPVTESGADLGTTPYLAPEALGGRRHPVAPTRDVFALGVVLAELLTLAHPFAADRAEAREGIRAGHPGEFLRRCQHLPADVVTVCLTAMAARPEHRYADAGALHADLARILTLQPIHARRAPWWRRAGGWLRRHPSGAAAAVVGVTLALAAAGGTWLWLRQQQRAQRLRRADSMLRQFEPPPLVSASLAVPVVPVPGAPDQTVLRLLAVVDSLAGDGQQERAIAVAELALELADDVVDERLLVARCRATLASLLAGRGEGARALVMAEQAVRDSAGLPQGRDVHIAALCALGEMELRASYGINPAAGTFARALALGQDDTPPALRVRATLGQARYLRRARRLVEARQLLEPLSLAGVPVEWRLECAHELATLACDQGEPQLGRDRLVPLLQEIKARHPVGVHLQELHVARDLAECHWLAGDRDLALEWFAQVDALDRHLLVPNARERYDGLLRYGNRLASAGRGELAVRILQEALQVGRVLDAEGNGGAGPGHGEADAAHRLGVALRGVGRLADAEAFLQQSLAIVAQIAPDTPSSQGARHADLALVCAAAGRDAATIAHATQALDLLATGLGADLPDISAQYRDCLLVLHALLLRRGEAERARAAVVASVARVRSKLAALRERFADPTHPYPQEKAAADLARVRILLTEHAALGGELSAEERDLEACVAELTRRQGPRHPWTLRGVAAQQALAAAGRR